MSKIYVDEIAPKTTGGDITLDTNILTPNRPAFMARKTDGGAYSTINTTISFNEVVTASDAWDGSTFTVPVSGLYHIFFSGHSNNTGAATVIELQVFQNGTSVAGAYGYTPTGGRERVTGVAVLNFSAGDAITIRLTQGGDIWAGGSVSSLTFGGYFIG